MFESVVRVIRLNRCAGPGWHRLPWRPRPARASAAIPAAAQRLRENTTSAARWLDLHGLPLARRNCCWAVSTSMNGVRPPA